MLTVLVLQSGGMLVVFNMQQRFIQFEMAQRLESSNGPFEKLLLTVSEFEKSRIDAKEIRLNGRMYDIKSVTVTADSVEIYAIHDLEEEDIMEKIKQLVKNTCSPHVKIPPHLQQLISLVYLPSHLHLQLTTSLTGIHVFHLAAMNTLLFEPGIPSPPPRLA